jgi:tetratricopeptide (TPR) repeat protein
MSDEQFVNLLRLGTRLLRQGKSEDALPLLRRAHELEPDNFDAALNLSGAYILQKKFRKAVPLLETLRDEEPDNAMVWTNLGAAYLGNPVLATDEQQQKAIDAFKQALELQPDARNVAYNIGLVYRDRRETGEAIRWFERALEINPDDEHARNILEKLRNGEQSEESDA